MKRIFIVGYPRSGTTLVQAMLASHPRLVSFPESHFFASTWPQRRLPRLLRLPKRGLNRHYVDFLDAMKVNPVTRQRLCQPYSATIRIRTFVSWLDACAESQDCAGWIEKTPRHLHYLDTVKTYLPHARVVHVVRCAYHAIASLYHETSRVNASWGRARSLDQCIERWIRDVEISLRAVSRDPQLEKLVRYEDVLADPCKSMRELCTWLGLEFTDEMITNAHNTSEMLTLPAETWKQRNATPVDAASKESKYHTFLTESERNRIELQLKRDASSAVKQWIGM